MPLPAKRTHDDALGDSDNLILPIVDCRLKEVVGGLFERGKHENTFLDFGNPKTRDSKHIATVAGWERG